MDSALRVRFLELLNWDLAGLDYIFIAPPVGDEWWPVYRCWWTGRDPRPIVRHLDS